MFLGLKLGVTALANNFAPGLGLSATSAVENGAQNADILTFSYQRATSPTAVSLTNVSPSGSVQMNADGVTLEYGANPVLAATNPFITFTASYSDSKGGPYSFNITLLVTQINKPVGGDFAVQFVVPPDEDDPTVSSPTRAASGSTGFTGSIATSEPGIVRYVVILNSATTPTIDQIEAGLDGDGGSAPGGVRSATAASATTVNVSGSGLTANTTYKIAYAMRDNAGNPSNVSASASFTTAASATAPAQMSAPTVTTTCTRATVTFASAPSDGGSAITSYDTRYSTNGGGAWTTVTGTTTGHVITGLTPGIANVEFQTRAVNAIGAGSWSSSYTISMLVPVLVGKRTFSPSRNSTDNVISLTSLTGGIDTQPSADDVVVLAYGTGTIGSRAIGVVAGDAYTTFVSKIYQNNTEDLNFWTGYKKMGATPDTQVTVTGTLNSADAGAIVIMVWRYIDPTTPLDVTTVSTSGSGGQPVPGAITPVTQHAPIIVMGGGAGVTCVDFTSSDLSDFTPFTGNGTHDVAVGMGWKDWTSGAFTAATFGGGEASASNARAAVVAALRPY